MPFRSVATLCSLFLFFSLPGQITAQTAQCGTQAILAGLNQTPGLTPTGTSQNRRVATRPTQPGEAGKTGGFGHTYTVTPTFYNTPQGHFKIWYVTSGSDRPGAGRPGTNDADNNGVPDWVERCGEFFETSWEKEITGLGYRPPPSDFQYHAQYTGQGLDDGGDARYDVYVQDIGSGIAGYTAPETVINGRKVPSYIVVDNDYAGVKSTLEGALDLLRATAAHELFHAIQFGYDFNEEAFWLEMTATWMEDQVFDEVNDYLTYLSGFSGFLTQPWVALETANGQHEFAGALWPIYLSERFGQSIIRETWDLAENFQGLDIIDRGLQSRSSNLIEAFREFTVWNVFTGHRADTTRYYEEGALYPLVVAIDSTRTFPYSGPVTASNRLPSHLGANYVVFYPDPFLPGGMRLSFTGLTGEWGIHLVATSVSGADTVISVALSSQQGLVELYDWNRFDTVFLVAAALNRTGFNYQYSFSATYDSTLIQQHPEPEVTLTNGPNPFSLSTHGQTFFRYNLPESGNVTLTLFNILGQQVVTLVNAPHPAGKFFRIWDGVDASGRRVASGRYILRLVVTNNTGQRVVVHDKMTLLK